MSKVVIFPVARQAEAQAYLDFLNQHNPDTTPGAIWAILRQGQHGHHVVPFLGPDGHAGGEWPEPVGADSLRASGVLAPAVDWPVEE